MICHQQRCLYIHIPKTAGQSVERVFLALNGLTWETREALLLRPNDDPDKGPPRLAHLTAGDYLRYGYLTPDQFQSYFKFAFVRNPWARMVSFYKYLSYGVTFPEFVFGDFQKKLWTEMYWFTRPQAEFLYDNQGHLLVDFVGRFERLQDDFNEICQRVGLPPTPLPHVNKSKKHAQKVQFSLRPRRFLRYLRHRGYRPPAPQFPHWRDYYDEATRALVAELYRADIERFGYTFDAGE